MFSSSHSQYLKTLFHIIVNSIIDQFFARLNGIKADRNKQIMKTQKYQFKYYKRQIQALDLLADDGIILAEHDARSALPEEIGELERVRVFRYGKTSLSMYRRKEEQAAE